MSRIQYDFTLLLDQDVIISETSATAGQHLCLDYIPGATLLGLAASRLYAGLDSASAWLLFHSGKVRFADALPCSKQGLSGWPLPLALHSYKGDPFKLDHPESATTRLDSRRLFNPALGDNLDPSRQPKQLRNGYLTDAGEFLEPERNQRMKTAIDRNTSRAAESQLFGYQSLQAGQAFHFSLIADTDVNSRLLEQLRDCLIGPARLGRSRSAQYGGATIQASKTAHKNLRQSTSTNDRVQLWLLSDLALLAPSGDASLLPDPQQLGLPEGSHWCPERSFLRSRSYSPYNAKRRCYDPQRQVISRGSVLTFTLPKGAACPEPSLWAGLYQESGLGRIMAQPQLLQSAEPDFEPVVFSTAVITEKRLTPPTTPLIALLQRKVGDQGQSQQAQTIAQDIYNTLLEGLDSARRWQGLRGDEPLIAPNRSQWGQIKSLCSDNRKQPDLLWHALFDGPQALLRERQGQPGWDLELGPKETLRACLHDQLKPHQTQSWLPDMLARIAVLALGSNWQQRTQGQSQVGDLTKEKQA